MADRLIKRLKRCIKNDKIHVLKRKLSNKVYPIQDPEYAYEVIKCSIKNGKYDMFEFLVKYTNFNMDYRQQKNNGSTLLMDMVSDYDVSFDMIICVINRVKYIDNKDDFGYTALYFAFYRAAYANKYIILYHNESISINIIIELLKHGADPNIIVPDTDHSIIDSAINDGLTDIVEIIVKYSKHDILHISLYKAISKGVYDIVEILVNNMGDINNINIDNLTPLQYARTQEKINQDIIELLTETQNVL